MLPAQNASEQGSFVVRQGTDTIAVERFTRTPRQLQGELETRTPTMRLSYTATISPDALIPRIELQAGPLRILFRGVARCRTSTFRDRHWSR